MSSFNPVYIDNLDIAGIYRVKLKLLSGFYYKIPYKYCNVLLFFMIIWVNISLL